MSDSARSISDIAPTIDRDSSTFGDVKRQRLARVNKRGQATHDRILTAATTVFERRGLELTLEEVAVEAGITRMTVHRHTGGRGPLIAHVLGVAAIDIANKVTAVFAADDRPFGEELTEAVVVVIAEVRAVPALLKMFDLSITGESLSAIDPDQLAVATVRKFFLKYLEKAEADGLLRLSAEASVAWMLEQILLYLMIPEALLSNDSVQKRIETFVVPALLA